MTPCTGHSTHSMDRSNIFSKAVMEDTDMGFQFSCPLTFLEAETANRRKASTHSKWVMRIDLRSHPLTSIYLSRSPLHYPPFLFCGLVCFTWLLVPGLYLMMIHKQIFNTVACNIIINTAAVGFYLKIFTHEVHRLTRGSFWWRRFSAGSLLLLFGAWDGGRWDPRAGFILSARNASSQKVPKCRLCVGSKIA